MPAIGSDLDHFLGIFFGPEPKYYEEYSGLQGGFDSKYGGRVSGIVDITGKSGNQQKTEFYRGVNLINANLTAEINSTRTYDRLPTYFRIDFSVNYNFNLKKVNIRTNY
jgi:hypothetical protein